MQRHHKASAGQTATQQNTWATARYNRPLDVEMMSLLSMHLHEDFTRATGWQDLAMRLGSKGFSLKTDGHSVRLMDTHSRVEICTSDALGFPPAQLAHQLSAARH